MNDALPGDIFARGQILNNTYEIEGVLGRGGTGEVYRARNLVSGRVVAIKALNQQFSGKDAYVDLMKREEEMRDIQHDAVVRYTECSRSDQGHVFLVMDYIDGPAISEVMQTRRLDPRELLVIAHRVAEGLVAAHRRGIVHRDLSPDNIILRNGEPERATIIDFGIAKDTAAGARTIVGNDFAGKYEYAAPEQLEGRAETRSDLYALGALLLAAFRGSVPFAGSTPGEMVRRKQHPLETDGVPEPLRGLIDRLAAPRVEDRPASAEVAADEIARLLRLPGTTGSSRQGKPARPAGPSGAGRRLWPALAGALLVAAGGLWYSGLAGRLLVAPLPVASPYVLEARAAGDAGPAALSGNAPSPEAAARLAQAFAAGTGAAVGPEALDLAQGQPFETWTDAAVAGLRLAAGLSDWSLSLADRTTSVRGVAADRPARATALAAFETWARDAGLTLRADIATGPARLPADTVSAALRDVADCGPLVPDLPPGQSYPLGATVRISGDISDEAARPRIAARIAELAGDRQVSVAATALNRDLCAIRNVLPEVPSGDLSIWMGDGATGAANLTGVYHAGDNPIVEVQAPAGLTDGSLWVAVIDNTGKVFNVLPNAYAEQHDLVDVGVVENGVRRIRVLHSLADQAQDPRRMAFKVTAGDFGKSEVVAILSRKPLFDVRRPRDESVASFAEALAEIRQQDAGNIVALASRLLDTRP